MKIIKFNKRSQVTIPKKIVDSLQLIEGDQLIIKVEHGRIILEPTVTVLRSQFKSK